MGYYKFGFWFISGDEFYVFLIFKYLKTYLRQWGQSIKSFRTFPTLLLPAILLIFHRFYFGANKASIPLILHHTPHRNNKTLNKQLILPYNIIKILTIFNPIHGQLTQPIITDIIIIFNIFQLNQPQLNDYITNILILDPIYNILSYS